LDMDVEVGLKRASSRAGDESRFESKGIEFHQKVRMAFLELAEEHNSRFVVIDAARSVDAVAGDVADIVLPRLRAAQLA
ncbi:MAG: dTMP kinase, partial [Candidatus Puniceispirillaceae bacterium]